MIGAAGADGDDAQGVEFLASCMSVGTRMAVRSALIVLVSIPNDEVDTVDLGSGMAVTAGLGPVHPQALGRLPLLLKHSSNSGQLGGISFIVSPAPFLQYSVVEQQEIQSSYHCTAPYSKSLIVHTEVGTILLDVAKSRLAVLTLVLITWPALLQNENASTIDLSHFVIGTNSGYLLQYTTVS